MKPYKKVSFEKESIKHFAEHEILLSFVNDLGAEAFEFWWDSEGSLVFNDWLLKDEYFKSEAD